MKNKRKNMDVYLNLKYIVSLIYRLNTTKLVVKIIIKSQSYRKDIKILIFFIHTHVFDYIILKVNKIILVWNKDYIYKILSNNNLNKKSK